MLESERRILGGAGHEVELHELHNPQASSAAVRSLAQAPWNAAASHAVVAHATAFGADVVHVHNTWFALSPAVFPALRKAGFPIVATIHNYRLACVNALLYRDERICEDCVGRLPWRGVLHSCYRDSAIQSATVAVTIATHRVRRTWERDVDVVVALTPFAADLLARSGVPADRIVVKANTVDDPGERPRQPSASRTVLFVGRMTEEKGVLDLMAAWSGLSGGDLELVMIGDGPLLDTVRTCAGPGINVAGREPAAAIAERMVGSRALVLPSRWYEGLPMVLLEAMSAGLGVVVPSHGALSEIGGSGATVFASGDRQDLARALDSLSADADVDRLGAEARRRYLAHYSPAVGVAQLEAVYQRAIEARTGR